jgi:hypothetical protein
MILHFMSSIRMLVTDIVSGKKSTDDAENEEIPLIDSMEFPDRGGTMPRGICVNCGKQVGGFMQLAGLVCNTQGCQNFGRLYCYNCVPKHRGLLSQTPVCPQCGRVMRQ